MMIYDRGRKIFATGDFLNGNRLVVPRLSFEQPEQNVIQAVHYSSVLKILSTTFTEVF